MRVKEMQSEIDEQCRLLGMSGSREAALLAKLDRLTLLAQVAIGTLNTLGKRKEADILKEMLAEALQ